MQPDNETAVLSQALQPLSESLTRAEAVHLIGLRPDGATVELLDRLSAKANEGELTAEEHRVYEAHVRAGNLMTVLQAKARAVLADSP